MAISVTDPISQAYDRTVLMLFKPFSAGKWFTLGFCAWLSMLGEGGWGNFQIPGPGGGGPRPPGPRGRRQPGETFPEILEEIKQLFLQHAYWIVPVAIAALALVVALMWVRARGKFMFLEAVAFDRAAVVEPWKRLRPLANSFFRFELALSVVALLTFALVALAVFLLALPDIRAQQISGPTIAALVIGGLLVIGGAIGFGLISVMAEDFFIPIMYLRGQSIGPAWREFRLAILSGNVGSIVLFYLMRIVVGMAAAMVMVIGTCITCCLAGLPYVYAVVFLPLFVFTRAYSLYFLRQFGPHYNLLADIILPPPSAFPVLMPARPSDEPPPPPPPG